MVGVKDHACGGGGLGTRFFGDGLGVGMAVGASSFAMNGCWRNIDIEDANCSQSFCDTEYIISHGLI